MKKVAHVNAKTFSFIVEILSFIFSGVILFQKIELSSFWYKKHHWFFLGVIFWKNSFLRFFFKLDQNILLLYALIIFIAYISIRIKGKKLRVVKSLYYMFDTGVRIILAFWLLTLPKRGGQPIPSLTSRHSSSNVLVYSVRRGRDAVPAKPGKKNFDVFTLNAMFRPLEMENPLSWPADCLEQFL